MASEFPRRPKTVKGALMSLRPDSGEIRIDPGTPALIFQYNPETLSHTFSSPNAEEESQKEGNSDASSILELIGLTVEFDAADQLEHAGQNRAIVEHGLHPTLAVLETIMHSQSKSVNKTSPILVFLFGHNRTVPVWLENLKVVEQAFDPNLNPIRTSVELVMRVRGLSEFKKGSIGHAICKGYLNQRQALSKLYPQNGNIGKLFDQVNRSIHH